jgi:hypothetical protein
MRHLRRREVADGVTFAGVEWCHPIEESRYMASLKTSIVRVPLAMLMGSALCTVALLAQTTQTPTCPNAPQGFDVPRQGIATGRVERVEYTSSVTGGK